MKFTVFNQSNQPIVSDRDDVTLQLSVDHLGVLRWQVVDNSSQQIIAANCRQYHIAMEFAFHKGAR